MWPEILTFVVITLALEVTPGPAVLFVLYQSAHGMKHVLLGVFGLLAANIVWISLVATGLGLLLVGTPPLFMTLRYIGAIYLIYLGYKIARYGVGAPKIDGEVVTKSRKHSFAQGVMTSLSNPKALLFFLALFPQFVRPEASYYYQDIVIFGALKMLMLAVVMTSYGYMGKQLFSRIINVPWAKWVFRGLGAFVVLAAFGVAFG